MIFNLQQHVQAQTLTWASNHLTCTHITCLGRKLHLRLESSLTVSPMLDHINDLLFNIARALEHTIVLFFLHSTMSNEVCKKK